MTGHLFDDHSDVYEALVDWPKRLAREAAFYRPLFQEQNIRQVRDVACGTGHHAAMFHEWGITVHGCDANPAMIQRARERFGEPPGLTWQVQPFELAELSATRPDAILCVGNSLALASDESMAQRAVENMLATVRPGGTVVIHLLNLQSLPDGPCVWQKCIAMSRAERHVLVTKGVQRSGSRGYVNLLINSYDPPALISSESVRLLLLTADHLSTWATQQHAAVIHCLGDYQHSPFAPATSSDLIVVLRSAES